MGQIFKNFLGRKLLFIYSLDVFGQTLIRFDSVMEDIKPFLIQDCLHLDVGGYAGHFSYYLSNHVKESHCLDVSSYFGQMQDESAPVSLSLFFVVLLIRKDFS